jgi:hypothetical protein
VHHYVGSKDDLFLAALEVPVVRTGLASPAESNPLRDGLLPLILVALASAGATSWPSSRSPRCCASRWSRGSHRTSSATSPAQILLCGLFVPLDQLPTGLDVLSDLLPLSYAVDAMNDTAEALPEMRVIAGFAVGLLALGAATLRRRTA